MEFREIVLLADVEEFSYKEIAETLKISTGNSDVQIESRKEAATARASRSSSLVWYQPTYEAGRCGRDGMNNLSLTPNDVSAYVSSSIRILAMSFW